MVSSTRAPSSAAGAEGEEEEDGERNTESTAFVGGELTKPGGEFAHFAPDMYSANDIARCSSGSRAFGRPAKSSILPVFGYQGFREENSFEGFLRRGCGI